MGYLGLDIGTSSVKALLVDAAQRVVAVAAIAAGGVAAAQLWSEQDPEDWWRATLAAVAGVRAAAPEAWRGLAGIGLSGQMHGATLLDAAGRVLRPAILWNDGRSFAECEALHRLVPDFTRRAGNIAMPGFTAPKLLWVREHEPDIFAATRTVLLPKDYIRYRLTGESSRRCRTPPARSGSMSPPAPGMTRCLPPPGSAAPTCRRWWRARRCRRMLSAGLAADWGVGRVAVAGGGGDNAASAVGIGAVRAGEGFLSLGTSGVLFAVTDHYVTAPERTLHAFCHALPGRWHGMTVALSAAASLSWVAEIVGATDIGALLARVEAWAASAANRMGAPLFLPYLSGERTPHNDPMANGLFAGLRAGHGQEALVYAVLEGVAFAQADGLDVLSAAGAPLTSCLLVGGGARSRMWCQMLADVLGIALQLPEGAETGAALGAARLAMLAAGAGDETAVCVTPSVAEAFSPDGAAHAAYAPRLARFRALYPAEKGTRG